MYTHKMTSPKTNIPRVVLSSLHVPFHFANMFSLWIVHLSKRDMSLNYFKRGWEMICQIWGTARPFSLSVMFNIFHTKKHKKTVTNSNRINHDVVIVINWLFSLSSFWKASPIYSLPNFDSADTKVESNGINTFYYISGFNGLLYICLSHVDSAGMPNTLNVRRRLETLVICKSACVGFA